MSRADRPPRHPGQRELFRLLPDGTVKSRTVYEPDDDLRKRHESMLARFYDYRIPMPSATGGIRGKSVLDNVESHRHNNSFYLIDINDAYPSVEIDELTRVAYEALAKRHAQPSDIREAIHFIETDALIDGVAGLPTGYPASPYLFNLYCKPMDDVLRAGLSLRHMFGATAFSYTRWLDDLTISSEGPISKHAKDWIREKVEERPGFSINHRKSKSHSLSKGPVTITGLSLYPDRHISLSPALMDKVNTAFSEMAERLATGIPLDEEELGVLSGYNSVLHMAGDPRRTGSARAAHLSKVYDRLAKQAKDLAA